MNKKELKEYFEGKKITLMGLGLLGRGVGDVEFLAKYGAELIVTDLKTKKELKKSLDRLKKYKNIKYTLGKHDLKDFKDRDLIIKSAGIPLDSPYIEQARKNKIPVEMSTALFSRLSGAFIIGVTGTRGKSTVTSMVYEILKKHPPKKVFLGGNIRGVSTLALLDKVGEGDTIVLELDSWQLQGFRESKISPQIAVFTNFMPDHLNYYKGNLNTYFNDKASIFLYQKKGDVLICSKEVHEMIKNKKNKSKGKIVKVVGGKGVELKILGHHNQLNAQFALSVADQIGIDRKFSEKVLKNYQSMPGRLEFLLKTKNGVSVYNDTNSTTPEALTVALDSFEDPNKTVLICGGSNKNIDLTKLPKILKEKTKKIILLPGTGTDELIKVLNKKDKNLIEEKIIQVKNLKEAVKIGFAESAKNDSLLFSPGFASFGLFKNEYDRGDQFVKLVKQSKK